MKADLVTRTGFNTGEASVPATGIGIGTIIKSNPLKSKETMWGVVSEHCTGHYAQPSERSLEEGFSVCECEAKGEHWR